jgi:hypothetical protein
LLRVRCHRSKGSSADVLSAYQSPDVRFRDRRVTGLTTATRCLRSARRPVEGLA